MTDEQLVELMSRLEGNLRQWFRSEIVNEIKAELKEVIREEVVKSANLERRVKLANLEAAREKAFNALFAELAKAETDYEKQLVWDDYLTNDKVLKDNVDRVKGLLGEPKEAHLLQNDFTSYLEYLQDEVDSKEETGEPRLSFEEWIKAQTKNDFRTFMSYLQTESPGDKKPDIGFQDWLGRTP